jgi:hypothetical protein
MADEQQPGAVVPSTKAVAPSTEKEKPPRVLHYVVAWLVAVLAFGLGTLKSDAIKQAFPFCCLAGYNYPSSASDWTWSYSAILFWAAAFLWMILYGLRLRAESKQAALLREQSTKVAESITTIQGGTTALQEATAAVSETVERTAGKAEKLEGSVNEASKTIGQISDAVQTLPPDNYIRALKESLADGYIFCSGLLPRKMNTDRTDLERLIRRLLRSVAELARTYDVGDARHAANVMYFVPKDDNATFEQEAAGYERFLPKQPGGDVKGALVLLKALTAAAGSDEEDGSVIPISLPIVEPYLSSGKLRVLLGAPLAFVERRKNSGTIFLSFPDLRKIYDALDESFDFPATVGDALKEHRGSTESAVGSGISFPLLSVKPCTQYDRANSPPSVLGVLNVHCNREKMLNNLEKRHWLFAVTVLHLVNEIAEATALWLVGRNLTAAAKNVPVSARDDLLPHRN